MAKRCSKATANEIFCLFHDISCYFAFYTTTMYEHAVKVLQQVNAQVNTRTHKDALTQRKCDAEQLPRSYK